MADYTSTGSGDSGSWEEILRRIQAGIGSVLNPNMPNVPPPNYPNPPVYYSGVGGDNSTLILVGLLLLAVYLMTRR